MRRAHHNGYDCIGAPSRILKCWPILVGAVGVPGWPREPSSADLFPDAVIKIYYYIALGQVFYYPDIGPLRARQLLLGV